MIANYQDLEAYVAANIVEGKENYLFIDEVQEISDLRKHFSVSNLMIPARL